jgi:3-deoxy-7-phosphoheptulonate synthase
VIAVLEKECPLECKAAIVRFVENCGFRAQVSQPGEECWIGVIGQGAQAVAAELAALPGVKEVRLATPPFPQVSRDRRPEGTVVKVGPVRIGGEELVVAAGPCAVESEAQVMRVAAAVSAAGARLLRGGAFKPRSSPYSFQGLGSEGLRILSAAREATGLMIVTEVVSSEDVDKVSRHADLLQIGARNMQNFRLLSAVGGQPKPVLLKRGMMATLEELLLAAEYVVSAGNPRVILCERGIRTFETSTRNTLDVSAVPVLREKSHLPVIVDPSHAAGRRELVPALARAAVAAGADGLLVEVHPDPDQALSDGRQSLTLQGFRDMMEEVRGIAAALGRPVGGNGAVPASSLPALPTPRW